MSEQPNDFLTRAMDVVARLAAGAFVVYAAVTDWQQGGWVQPMPWAGYAVLVAVFFGVKPQHIMHVVVSVLSGRRGDKE